jgi:hypothetical protein
MVKKGFTTKGTDPITTVALDSPISFLLPVSTWRHHICYHLLSQEFAKIKILYIFSEIGKWVLIFKKS